MQRAILAVLIVWAPLFVLSAIESLVLEKNKRGIFHIAGKDTLTPYQIANETATYLKLDSKLIEKASIENFSQAALRPPTTGFIIEKARAELNYQPHSFREILPEIFKES